MDNKIKKWILWGIPVIIVLAFPMHFIWEWTNENVVIASFAPVNESIWEHLKLAFWPSVIWFVVGYFLLSKHNDISKNKWFTSCLGAVVLNVVFIIVYYYTYTGAFGINSEILNILSIFFSTVLGQYFGLYLYKNDKAIPLYLTIIILAFIAILFAFYTFNPPHIPLFEDSTTGMYGIS